MRAGIVRPTFFVCVALCAAFLFSSLANRASLSTQTEQRRLGRDQATVSEKRVALVIGNGAYAKGRLKNPPNDARAMAAALREVGFEVQEVIDADKVRIQRAMRDFGKKLRERGGVGLFYYAGHGVQVQGKNYLVPLGAETEVEAEADVEIFCIDAENVLRQMEDAGSRVNIVILDACRNNPFSQSFSRDTAGGLAEIKAPSGTLIAYATDPGKTASDGDGDNGLYTQELLTRMRERGLRIEDVFNLAGAEVERKSGRKQQPWISSKLRGAFFFRPPVEPAIATPDPKPVRPVDPAAAEQEAWEVVRGSTDPEDFREFLKLFPDGVNAGTAKLKLRKLEAAANTSSGIVGNFTREDVSKVVADLLPPEQLSQLRSNPKLREEFRKKTVRLLAMYAEAEQRGMLRRPDIRRQLDVVYTEFIADFWNKSDEGKKNPVRKEDVTGFFRENPTAFDDFITQQQPKLKQAPDLDAIKQQFGEMVVAKQRAEAAGVQNRRDFQLEWKFCQISEVAVLIVEELRSSVNVTDQEIRAFYNFHKFEFEEMRTSHILISTIPKEPQPGPDGKTPTETPKPLTREEARKKAEDILARIKAGGDFAGLAAENSDDSTKAQGGDLGYLRMGIMVKPFEDAAKSLKPGEITSDVVETQFGFHIIKLNDRRIAPLDNTLKAEIRERLKNDKLDARLDEVAKKYNIQFPADFDVPEPKTTQTPQ